MKIPINEIKPNPINDEIYSPTDLHDLELSLSTHGLLEPIVINKKRVLISGHRRFYAMKRLKWKECEVRVHDPDNLIITLIEHNRHRVKSVTDILNESRFLEREFKKQIGRGKYANAPRNGKKLLTVIEISKKLGLSTTQLKKIKSISNYEPDLITKIDNGDISLHKAYETVRKKHILKESEELSKEEQFGNKFRSLIRTYKPNKKQINEIIEHSYPFNIENLKDGEEKRSQLIENLDFYKNLDSKEDVLYKKYLEVNKNKFDKKLIKKVEKQLWSVTSWSNRRSTIKEIEQLQPKIVFVDKSNLEEFNILRQNIHSMEFVPNPGRNLKCFVIDETTEKYLGLITLGSDVIKLENRDKFIGWSEEDKFKKKKLNNIGIMSSCVSVQPFGFNCLGGKLISMIATTPDIRDQWKKQYDDVLVGLTTTSLFGQFSQYDGVPIWKGLGETKGHILIKPDDEHFNFWRDWLKKNHKKVFDSVKDQSSPKQKIINLIFQYLDINPSQYRSEYNRGLYFCSFYDNGKQFLNSKIKEDELKLNQRIEDGMDYILNWWKEKSITRYTKLHKTKKLKMNNLWYETINPNIFKSWLLSRGI